MENWNKNSTSLVPDKLINQFSKMNSTIYNEAVYKSFNTISKMNTLDLVSELLVKSKLEFNINSYNFDEYLTTLGGSIFVNTYSYLQIKAGVNAANAAKQYLTSINKETNNVISYGFDLIDVAASNVIDDGSLSNQISIDKQIVYKQMLDVIKNELGTKIVPNIINSFINIRFNVSSEETERFKLDMEMDAYIKLLNNKITILTKERTREIYNSYMPNNNKNKVKSKTTKIPFSDFDQENEIFDAKFDDELKALEILGLDRTATISNIKKAYKQLAAIYHPDNNKSLNAEIEMKKINAAYNLLKNKTHA